MSKTKVSSRGQIVIPKPMRQRLGFKKGITLEVIEHGDQVTLSKSGAYPKMTWAVWLKKVKRLDNSMWEGIDPVQYVKAQRNR